MKKLIRVTQADINRGVKKLCHYCPVAIALNRAFNIVANKIDYTNGFHVRAIAIDPPDGLIQSLNGRVLYCPKSVIKFIKTFDNCKKDAKPFNFYLIY